MAPTLPFTYLAETDDETNERKKSKRKLAKSGDIDQTVHIKKRCQYQNEMLMCEKREICVPNSYGDRFIPRRYFCKQPSRIPSFKLVADDDTDWDIFSIKDKNNYWRLHSYRENVKISLGLDENENILKFHDPTPQEVNRRTFNNNPTAVDYHIHHKNIEALG